MKVCKELKIGSFIVVVLTASFFLINYLRGEDIFNREMDLKSNFDDLHGLVASAPVHIKGFKAGEVTSVTYIAEEGQFEVVCSVLKEFKVPADSRMVIYGVDIMGGKGVKIDLGTSPDRIEDGGYLQPAFFREKRGTKGAPYTTDRAELSEIRRNHLVRNAMKNTDRYRMMVKAGAVVDGMIEQLLEVLEPGDIIICAGKGHETYQITQNGTIHFDEREIIADVLAN